MGLGRVYFLDETPLLAQYGPRTIAIIRGSQKRPNDLRHTKILTSALGVITGVGEKLPLILIKKGTTHASLARWHQFGVLNVPSMNVQQRARDDTLYALTTQELTDTRNGIGLIAENAWMNNDVMSTILTQIIAPHARLRLGRRQLRQGEPLCAVVMDQDKSHISDATSQRLILLNMASQIIPARAGPEADPLDAGVWGPFKAMLKAEDQAEFRGWKLVYFREILKYVRDQNGELPDIEAEESGMEALDGTVSRALGIWNGRITRRMIKQTIASSYPE